MASAQTTEVFNCTPEQFYSIVSDYAKYPEFLQEVKKCQVLKVEGPQAVLHLLMAIVT